MLVVIFAVLASCQMFGCAPQDAADHGCCSKHATPKAPCLHELLGQGRAGVVLAHGECAAPAAPVSILPISKSLSTVQTETRQPNLAGLYLRNRVLLI